MECDYPDEEKGRFNNLRAKRQFDALGAILFESKFDGACILVGRDGLVDGSVEKTSFQSKGLIRCDMISDDEGKRWRRLMGATTKNPLNSQNVVRLKKDRNFTRAEKDLFANLEKLLRRKKIPEYKDWRGRATFYCFRNGNEACDFLSNCPARCFKEENSCPLARALSENPCGSPLLWIQVQDVSIGESRTFSEMLRDRCSQLVHASKKCKNGFRRPFIYARCPGKSKTGPVYNGFSNFQEQDIEIQWRVQRQSLLHTGVSLDFSKSFFKYPGVSKYSRNLWLSSAQCPEKIAPAMTASSFKGLFRSATSWLFEKIARDCGWVPEGGSFTSDYHIDGDWPIQRSCPVRAIYGGQAAVSNSASAVSEGRENAGHEKKSEIGKVRFMLENGSMANVRVKRDWNKSPESSLPFMSRQAGALNVESIETGTMALKTGISAGPNSGPAFLSVCLAADLIGAGFFRIGRLTTRGFGLVRMFPEKFVRTNLADLFLSKGGKMEETGFQSGYALAFKILENEPLAILTGWLELFAKHKEAD